ncbi:MAG: AMP-binding protein [Sphingomonadaceae bacterium]
MVGVKRPMPGVIYPPTSVLDYYVNEGVLKDETLTDALAASCAQWPDRVALSEPGVTITYREFDEITDRAAAALHDLGLKPLDRVLFQGVNSKELLLAFFACIKAGLIPICTLAAHRGHEIQQIGSQAEAKAHIVSYSGQGFDLVEFAMEMRERLPSVDHVIAIQCGTDAPHGALSFDQLWQAVDAKAAKATVSRIREELDPYQVCIFQLSGGTSGTPKIIPRFHNEYTYTTRQITRFFGFGENVVSFTPNPMMHNLPMACFIIPALLAGGEVAVAPSPKIEVIAATIRERRPTWCAIMLVHILRMKEQGLIDENSFSGAYGLICPEKADKFSALINAPAYTLYGMTEGLLCHTRKEDSAAAIAGSVGNSISPYDEIRLVEPDSERDVEPGEIGELIVRGPSVTRGYYNSPERNAEAFTSDGYYRSGDLLSWRIIDGKRYLAFEGRVKDVIDRGGEKINASEVERLLNEHPKITATMCVGMPDPAFGERMCAFVVLAEGHASIGLREVTDHLEKLGVAKFKFPERVEIVPGFPIAVSGKPSKPMLREMITEKLEREKAKQSEVA